MDYEETKCVDTKWRVVGRCKSVCVSAKRRLRQQSSVSVPHSGGATLTANASACALRSAVPHREGLSTQRDREG
ncbi:hypothetical protein NIES4073_72700 [Kalymmatonema gypsitolerans NIES-4073]|nr:hypothetical protein NIES4073_72700 [Scytonema sp. NIES-4073]